MLLFGLLRVSCIIYNYFFFDRHGRYRRYWLTLWYFMSLAIQAELTLFSKANTFKALIAVLPFYTPTLYTPILQTF